MRRRPNSGVRRVLAIAALAATAVFVSAPAGAQTGPQPAASVNAEGNAFTGGLQFNPAAVSVKVGDTVRWTNTDALVPHTATEDHGLWNLTGTYGQTPANPAGFGPGETRERRFAAGTWSYFCEVHPTQMHGTITVPVELSLQPRAGKREKGKRRSAETAKRHRKRGRPFRVLAVWAAQPLPAGQVFDVQARRGNGDWKTVTDGTTALQGVFAAGKRAGVNWSYRARVRADDDRSRASGYSPEATITVG